MKKENGIGLFGTIIMIAFIIVVCIGVFHIIKYNSDSESDKNVKSNMLLIQAACKVKQQSKVVGAIDENGLIGTKISEIADNKIIDDFKSKGIIEESDYEKYYMLTDENLESLKIDAKNEENSYYLINYETNEVIITKGLKGLYKLTDIEQREKDEAEQNLNQEQQTENNDNAEDDKDNSDQNTEQ